VVGLGLGVRYNNYYAEFRKENAKLRKGGEARN